MVSPVLGLPHNPFTMTLMSACAAGVDVGAVGGINIGIGGTPGVANSIYTYGFTVYRPTFYTSILYGKSGSNAGLNVDIGVYNEAGAKVFSSGVTSADITIAQSAAVTINKTLTPGRYTMAIWFSASTVTFQSQLIAISGVNWGEAFGIKNYTGVAGGLPATMPGAFSPLTNTIFPLFGLQSRMW